MISGNIKIFVIKHNVFIRNPYFKNMENSKPANYAVIFDMDGVLIDSLKIIHDTFNEVLEQYGIHLDKEEHKKYCLGKSVKDSMKMWERDYRVNFDITPDEFSKKAYDLQINVLKNGKPGPELLMLLENLRQNNIPMGVGTSSTKVRAEETLKLLKINGYFPALVTVEDVNEHKPSPHVFLAVADKLQIPAECCAVIEDAAAGIEAAKRGNMKAIGYLTDYNSREELSKADLIISNFSELNHEKIAGLFK